MEPNLQTSRKRKKRIPSDLLPKRRRLSKGSKEKEQHRILLETALTDDWQLNMGASLAERLESIANEKKLTVPQVKRLLKAVLTNEDVVDAFRHYMDGQLALLEPETGEPSSATRRQAHLLGVDPTALSRCSNDPDIENPIVHRVLTRSVAKQIRSKDTGKAKPSRGSKTRCTLQDMIFPDDDDDAAAGAAAGDSNTANATSADQYDSDYQPTAADMEILQLDRLYDRLPDEPDVGLLSTRSEEEKEEEEQADSSRLSGEDDGGDDDVDAEGSGRRHHYFTRSCQGKASTNEDILDTPIWIREEVEAFDPLLQNGDNKKEGAADETVCRDDEAPNKENVNRPLQTETVCISEKPLPPQKSIPGMDESLPTDPEDNIYSSFLRSLFSPDVTPPNDNSEMPGESNIFLGQSNFGGLASPDNFLATPVFRSHGERWNTDEFDDPDFDVMAEIDNVCSEDLFDELRNDRAVRVSKIEAKELRRDLTELFTEDEEEYDEEVEDEEPNQETREKEQQALSVLPALTADEPPNSYFGSGTSVQPVSITLDMANRVKRQLSMHLQLLASTFAATITLSDLEETVCRPITSFVDQIHASLHRPSSLLASLSSIRDLLPVVDETRRFVHEFAGLSILPCFSYSAEDRDQLLNTRSIPLPFFLMDYILRSALWPYPDLLPPGLACPTSLAPQRQRDMFTTDEDSLLVLGIANFAEASPARFADFVEHCNLGSTTTAAAGDKPQRMQSSFFRFAATHLLPTRTPRQLYCRKCYIDFFGRLLAQRKTSGFGPGNSSFSSRSPLGLLLQDFQSPDFASVEAKLGLLRSCVPAFTRQTSSYRRPYAVGPIFSRPDVWHHLPVEYQACASSLARQMAIPSLLNSAPVPTRDCLNVRYHASTALTHFFDEAMLSWWPFFEVVEGPSHTDAPSFCVSTIKSSATSSFAMDNPVISGNLVVIGSLPCAPVKQMFQLILPNSSIAAPPLLPAAKAIVSRQPASKGAVTASLSRPLSTVASSSESALVQTDSPSGFVQKSVDSPLVYTPTQSAVLTTPPLRSSIKSRAPKPSSSISRLPRPSLPQLPSESQHDISLTSKAAPGTSFLRPIAPAPSSKPVNEPSCHITSFQSVGNKSPTLLLPRTKTISISPIRWKRRRKTRRVLTVDAGKASVPLAPPVPPSSTSGTQLSGVYGTPTGAIVGGFRRISPRPPNIPFPRIPAAPTIRSAASTQSPNVVKFIQAFHQSLDRVRSCLAGTPTAAVEPTSRRNATTASSLPTSALSTSTSRPVVGRFLRRCGWKKGVGGSDDLLLMTRCSSRRSSPAVQLSWGREVDEADVLYARALLDRCRVYLSPADHSRLVTHFSDISSLIAEHCRDQTSQASSMQPPLLLKQLSTVLNCLAGCRPLWEDFVCLLTPEQARALHLFPVYAHTVRVRSLQQTLVGLIPDGKRFWCRLRKLANSREPEEMRVPVAVATEQQQQQQQSVHQHPHMIANRRAFRSRARRLKPKPTKEVLEDAWSLLESSLRSRFAFLAQASACLEPNHHPYSNFPQAFEVVDSLARRPDPSINLAPAASVTAPPPPPLPRLVDELLTGTSMSAAGSNLSTADTFRWEVCTELASCGAGAGPTSALLQQPGIGSCRLSKATTARQCPCPCHDHQPAAQKPPPLTTAQSLSTVTPSGKPAKVDSLGLRHCIKCSLRVHQGVVYVDECNFHLNHVQITWPPDFTFRQPARSLPRFAQQNPPTTAAATAAAVGSAVSTRAALECLAAACLDPQSAASLPDMARRQVAVQFGTSTTSAAAAACAVGAKGDRMPTDEDEEEEELDVGGSAASSPAVSPSATSGSSVSSSAPPRPSCPEVSSPSVTWLSEVDDEAACFNTEAFSRHSETRLSNSSGTPEPALATTGTPWSLAEDRRLLEYCRGAGSYSRVNLVLLASVWPERTLPEIVNRFKYLMRIALGEEDSQTHMLDSSTETEESSQSSPVPTTTTTPD